MGHKVWPVASGAAVDNAAQIIQPDLILVEIGMQGVDGCEVARRLRMKEHGARVVALSGWASDEDNLRVQAAGFSGYLTKPVAMTTLKDLLSRIAERLECKDARLSAVS
jgi:CheY-like chemotaxis protein